MEELAGPEWWLDRKGEVPQGMQPYFRLPIVHYYNVSPAALASAAEVQQSQRSAADDNQAAAI